jgi:aerobic-type carbon monoxide dehydrogenase small subunit (CoxS/CutS family)
MRTVSFTLNGKPAKVTTDEARMLLWVLRDDLGLTGTKFGCGMTMCGSCTVVIGKEAVRACSIALKDVEGKSVTTIEGLMQGDKLHPIQDAFVKHAALQCGYCTPGMVMTAYAMLLKNPSVTHTEMLNELEGNACRCGAHVRILAAVEDAAAAMKAGAR